MLIRRALISVSDKQGLPEFAQALAARGVEILSTGGSAQLLTQAGVPVREVADYTGFPEMLDGRVKTLHPGIHGGILARRELAAHRQALAAHGIGEIDLVCVNLYPFAATIARPTCTLDEAIEQIDIGGPALLRAAAKNYASVAAVCDPADYPALLAELESQQGALSLATRRRLAWKAFSHTAAYDGAISNYLNRWDPEGSSFSPQTASYPAQLHLHFERVENLRYGENPHQQAAFYREREAAASSLARHRQLQGKMLSYNNLTDADAAWETVQGFAEPACVIVKHANPCGVAKDKNLTQAYRQAFDTDPVSAFGGILAFNRPLDADTTREMLGRFLEVVIAPAYDAAALALLAEKKNIRVLQIPMEAAASAARSGFADFAPEADRTAARLDPGMPGVPLAHRQSRQLYEADMQRISGGLLLQTPDYYPLRTADLTVVSRRQPSAAQWEDLCFAWCVVRHVKSNAIVFCADGRTLGIGAGQTSRIDACWIAAHKARAAGLDTRGAVCASDAFFPFRDGIDTIAQSGIAAVIHPGGSIRDAEIIAAANEHGLVLVTTGVRHFRH